jgi:hypothetical protein
VAPVTACTVAGGSGHWTFCSCEVGARPGQVAPAWAPGSTREGSKGVSRLRARAGGEARRQRHSWKTAELGRWRTRRACVRMEGGPFYSGSHLLCDTWGRARGDWRARGIARCEQGPPRVGSSAVMA